jgi:hypothetical protein
MKELDSTCRYPNSVLRLSGIYTDLSGIWADGYSLPIVIPLKVLAAPFLTEAPNGPFVTLLFGIAKC